MRSSASSSLQPAAQKSATVCSESGSFIGSTVGADEVTDVGAPSAVEDARAAEGAPLDEEARKEAALRASLATAGALPSGPRALLEQRARELLAGGGKHRVEVAL